MNAAPAQCVSIMFGIRKDFPRPAVSATLINHNGKTHNLVFFDADITQVFYAFDCTKLHNARGKWVLIHIDNAGDLLGISGYEKVTDIAYCVRELSR